MVKMNNTGIIGYSILALAINEAKQQYTKDKRKEKGHGAISR